MNPKIKSTDMKLLLLQLCLYLLCLPGITFSDGPVVVEEGSDVILPCSLSNKENIESKLFDWNKDSQKEVFLYDAGIHYNNGRPGQDEQFKGRVSHFPEQLKHGNASIIIRNTKVADSGDYTCVFPRLQPQSQIFHIELVVAGILKDRSKENIPGAAPKPSVTILDQTKDWSLLQCVVRGASPKPKVEWQDRAGNILPAKEPQVSERGGSYDIILQATVTKTDRYRCVATQEEISHQTHTEIYVPISGAKPYVVIFDITEDKARLQCEIQGASPKPKVEWQDSAGNILPAEETQVSERGGSYYITLQTTVTKTDRYRCVATQEDIKHQTHAKIYVPISGNNKREWISGFIFGCSFIILILVAVVFVLLAQKCIKRRNKGLRRKNSDYDWKATKEILRLRLEGYEGKTPTTTGRLRRKNSIDSMMPEWLRRKNSDYDWKATKEKLRLRLEGYEGNTPTTTGSPETKEHAPLSNQGMHDW